MLKRLIPLVELSLAQTAAGVGLVFCKLILNKGIPAEVHLFFRFLVCALFFGGIVIIKRSSFPRMNWKLLLLVIAQALCGGFLFNIFLVGGLNYTSASVAGIITSVLPAIITLMSFFILREKISSNKLLAIFLAIAGITILHLDSNGATASGPSGYYQFIGGLLVLLATIPEGAYSIFTKMIGIRIEPLMQAFLVNLVNAIAFGLFYFKDLTFEKYTALNAQSYLLFIGPAICGILFFYFWGRGLRKVQVNTAGLFTGIYPVATTGTAAFILRESLSTFDLIGMSFVLFSLFIGTLKKKGSSDIYSPATEEVALEEGGQH